MWMFHGIGLKSSNESFFGNTVLISNRCDYVFICTVVPVV